MSKAAWETTPIAGDTPLFGSDVLALRVGELGEVATAQDRVDAAAAALSAAVAERDRLLCKHFQAGKLRQADVARVTGLSRGRVSQIVAADPTRR